MKDFKRLTSYIQVGNKIVAIQPQRKERIQAYIDRLFDLEDKIERGEIDYVVTVKPEQTITDLLTEFDEMGFAPTTLCPDPEQYAIDWRDQVHKEFARLTAENDNLTVELEVAQRDIDNLTRTLEEANDEIKALEAENAALRARLGNAVEMPCVKIVKTKEVIDRVEIGDTIWEWAVVYIDKEGYFVVEPCASKAKAEARLEEVKGGRE